MFLRNPFSADFMSGLDSIVQTLKTAFQTIGGYVAGLGLVACVIVFVFNLIGFLRSRGDGDNHSGKIIAMAITVAVGLLLGTYGVWSPLMFG